MLMAEALWLCSRLFLRPVRQGPCQLCSPLFLRPCASGSLPVVLTALSPEDPGQPEGLQAAQEVIRSLGLAQALEEMGVTAQDVVTGGTGPGACDELQALQAGQGMSTVALAMLLLHLRRLKVSPVSLPCACPKWDPPGRGGWACCRPRL